MRTVEVQMPDNLERAIMDVVDQRIAKALAVAPEVEKQIKLTAIVDGVDVDGRPMPPKKPRPKKSPRNHPDAPLVDTGNMMDKSRWEIVPEDTHHVNIAYTPPAYFDYVVAQGRPWMTRSKINDSVRQTIMQQMRNAIRSAT